MMRAQTYFLDKITPLAPPQTSQLMSCVRTLIVHPTGLDTPIKLVGIVLIELT